MSTISDIFRSYYTALENSRSTYEDLYKNRSANSVKFYHDFFHKLVIFYQRYFEDPSMRRVLTQHLKCFFQQDVFDFIANDSTGLVAVPLPILTEYANRKIQLYDDML